tara:strand:+ start:2342 stop:2764 length:423 start_codon:yes stop_codon:yes gene_type:complete
MISVILDMLIPADDALGMPPASSLDFNEYITKYKIEKIVLDFLSELIKISIDEFSQDFKELNEEQREVVLNKTKLKDIRLFTTFVKHSFKAYYSDKRVLSLLDIGSSPPFPVGNVLEDDEWSILMPVYERGSFYRKFDED